MEAKKDLARRIVTDFHSADAAVKAAEDWAMQFQKAEVPTDVLQTDLTLTPEIAKRIVDSSFPDEPSDTVTVKFEKIYISSSEQDALTMGYFDVDIRSRRNDPSSKKLFAAAIRTDKLLVQAGLVSSASEAERKRKERAVKINGEVVSATQIGKFIPGELLVGVGRKLKKVNIRL
jgi:tyrosyl-tRNA synthetase